MRGKKEDITRLGKRESKFRKFLNLRYYNPSHPLGFGSKSQLFKALKNISKNPATREKVLENWLSSQNIYTLHKPVRWKYYRRRIVALGINHMWEADLIDFSKLDGENDGYKYILVIIDVFSKRADAIPVKNKQPLTVKKGFEKIIEEGKFLAKNPISDKPVQILRTDSGSEFQATFHEFVKSKGIFHLLALNPDVKASCIERWIRTLKSRLYKYFTHKGHQRYIDVLPALLNSYNNRYHTSIKMAPMHVCLENQDEVRKALYGTPNWLVSIEDPKPLRKSASFSKNRSQSFLRGQSVRIQKFKNIFAKGYLPNFTREIFIIKEKHVPIKKNESKHYVPFLYSLIDSNGENIRGKFYAEELVKVGKVYR